MSVDLIWFNAATFSCWFINLAKISEYNQMIRSRKTLVNQQDILSMRCQLISFVSLSLNTECVEAGLEDAWRPLVLR